MANTSAIWQQAAHTTYQLSSPGCSTIAIQKSLTLNEKIFESFLEKKSGEWTISRKTTRQKGQKAEAEKTKEEIGKGNQMTALRFQTGGGHQTSPASLQGKQQQKNHVFINGFNSLTITSGILDPIIILRQRKKKEKKEEKKGGWGGCCFSSKLLTVSFQNSCKL